jgi:hypothetical protein
MTIYTSRSYSPKLPVSAMNTTVGDFPALKGCVTRILSALAMQEAPDTYGCEACAGVPASPCAEHSGRAAIQEQLEIAAAMAAQARTRGDIEAALAYAFEGDAR